ncbi:MAG: hypothetical protein AB7M12_04930 [Hyphomonadaceae bacterium]
MIGRSALFACALALTSGLALAQEGAPASVAAAPPIRGGGVVVAPEDNRPKPPDGDPRSVAQRREDHMAFTKCVARMQGRTDDFSSPGLPPDPVSYCQQRLGMTSADAVPDSVRAKQR